MTRNARRVGTAVVLLALCGCASEDYGELRRSRFDRPYRGGAASVQGARSAPPTTSARSDPVETLCGLLVLGGFVAAFTGHADYSNVSRDELRPLHGSPAPSGR